MFRFISESSQCIVACPHNVWSVYICPTKALRHERRPKCRQAWQWHSKIGKKRRRCSQKRPLLPACTTSAPKKGHSIPRFWQPPPSLTSLKTDTTANWGFVLAWYSRIQSFKLSNQVKQSNGQRNLPPLSDMMSSFRNMQGSKPPYHHALWVRVTRWNWLIVDAHLSNQIARLLTSTWCVIFSQNWTSNWYTLQIWIKVLVVTMYMYYVLCTLYMYQA